jgi:thioredoxin-dependent peroxiredoxin
VPPKLREGDKAPGFSLPSQDGAVISLKNYLGKKNVVVYFYPKDFTMGCTAETKSFGAEYDKLVEMGAEVIGISSDSTSSHARFANDCGAKFPLLSDRGGDVRSLYGVQASLGLFPGRVTFVIDKEGVVRKVFSSQMNPKKHVEEATKALSALP